MASSPLVETKSAFARRAGLSKGRITQLLGVGLPVLPDGMVPIEAALRWLSDRADIRARVVPPPELATLIPLPQLKPAPEPPPLGAHPDDDPPKPKRGAAPPPPEPPPATPPRRLTGMAKATATAAGVPVPDSVQVLFNKARTQKEIKQAGLLAVKLQEAQGKLVNVREAQRAAFEFTAQIRACLQAFAPDMTAELARVLELDPARIFPVLDAGMRACLTEIAELPLPDWTQRSEDTEVVTPDA